MVRLPNIQVNAQNQIHAEGDQPIEDVAEEENLSQEDIRPQVEEHKEPEVAPDIEPIEPDPPREISLASESQLDLPDEREENDDNKSKEEDIENS